MPNFIDKSRRILGGGNPSGGGSIADQIAGGPPVAEDTQAPKTFGVPEDYEVAVRNQDRPGYYPHGFNYNARTYGAGAHPEEFSATVGPRYSEGDQWKLASLPAQSIAEIQRTMATAGLLDDFRYGIWDEQSAKAYSKVLAFANASGLTAQTALQRMASHPQLSMAGGSDGSGGGGKVVGFDENGNPIFAGPPPLQIQLTNRDDFMRVARGVVIDRLGQGWSQDQIAGLADAFAQKEIEVQRAAYEQQLAADSGALSGQEVVQPNMPSPETFVEDELRRRDPTGYQAAGVVQDSLPMFLEALRGWSA